MPSHERQTRARSPPLAAGSRAGQTAPVQAARRRGRSPCRAGFWRRCSRQTSSRSLIVLVGLAARRRGRTAKEGYGADVAERLFLFVQFEFPWELGPPDGRYLVRAPGSDEPEHVVVLGTLAASRRAGGGGFARARSRRRTTPPQPTPQPSEVPVARVTIVDPVSISAERQARAWLADLDAERDVGAAATGLPEVAAEGRSELSVRIAERQKLSAAVAAQDRAARAASEQGPSEEVVRHALERLEAALRARTAAGLR